MNVGALAGRIFAALRVRNYRLYFFSQVVSFTGTWAQSIALSWLVLDLTGSGAALGTVLAMQFLPTLLLGPMGGVLADRIDKRTLLVGTQAAGGVLAVALGVVTLSGVVELWMVYSLAAAFGVVMALDNPARQTFVMEMVGAEGLNNAVTLNSVVVNAARATGPALSGVIIALLGVGECFLFNGVSYLAVIVALLLIRRAELYPAARSARAPGQLREGLRYVRASPVLRTTLVMSTIIGMMTFEFTTTLPMLSDFTFDAGAGGLAMLTALMGIGAALGGLVVAAAEPPSPTRLIVVSAAFGAATLLVAVMPTLGLAYATMPIVGATSIATIATANTILQLNAESHLRGRVMSLFSVALIGSTPIGGPIVGWIGDEVGPRWSLAVGGVAALAAAAFGRAAIGQPDADRAQHDELTPTPV